MNNLKKNHRLTVVLFSFVSGIFIFPQLTLAQGNESDYIGISATGWATFHIVVKEGTIDTRVNLNASGGTGTYAEVSAYLSSIIEQQINEILGRLTANFAGMGKVTRTGGGKNPGEDIRLKENVKQNQQKKFTLQMGDNLNKSFDYLGEDIALFRLSLASFYNGGQYNLMEINTAKASSQKLRQSLSNFLINFKALSNDNSSPELLLAKQEILKSTQDLTNILEFTDQVLSAFNKAIAQSE